MVMVMLVAMAMLCRWNKELNVLMGITNVLGCRLVRQIQRHQWRELIFFSMFVDNLEMRQ